MFDKYKIIVYNKNIGNEKPRKWLPKKIDKSFSSVKKQNDLFFNAYVVKNR